MTLTRFRERPVCTFARLAAPRPRALWAVSAIPNPSPPPTAGRNLEGTYFFTDPLELLETLGYSPESHHLMVPSLKRSKGIMEVNSLKWGNETSSISLSSYGT